MAEPRIQCSNENFKYLLSSAMKIMKFKKVLFICLLITGLFQLSACQQKNVEKLSDGIILHLEQKSGQTARNIRINLVTEKIVRVVATPDESFQKEKSLMVVEQPKRKVAFSLSENNDSVTLKTSELSISVSKLTGCITFADKAGAKIMS